MPLRDIPVNTETSLSAVFFLSEVAVSWGEESDFPGLGQMSLPQKHLVQRQDRRCHGDNLCDLGNHPNSCLLHLAWTRGLNIFGERGERLVWRLYTPRKLPLNDCYVFLQGLKMVIFFLWPPKPKFWTLRLTLDLDKYFSIWRFFWDTWTAAHGVVGCWVDSGVLS